MDSAQERQVADGPLGPDDRRHVRVMWWERTERRRRFRAWARWLGGAIVVILTAVVQQWISRNWDTFWPKK